MAKGNYFEVPGLVEVDSRLCCTSALSGFEAARFKIFERYKYYSTNTSSIARPN
jgi:hypothetical protein